MKALLMKFCVWAWILSAIPVTAGSAAIKIANSSIKMNTGACSCGFGVVYKIHFSTYSTDDPRQANREIAPRPAGASTTHWSFLIFEDASMWAVPSYVEINLPLAEDADGNGVSDFYETEREISAESIGYYDSDLLGGTLSMKWTRSAGSLQGSCELYMIDNILGKNGPFKHTFELVEGVGTLDYTRAGDAVAGFVDLQINGTRLKGPIELTRDSVDPCNVLSLGSGMWTNAEVSFIFDATTLVRATVSPKEYRGQVSNPGATYGSWALRIIDEADSDKNGVPDLSDNLAPQPPPRPAIGLGSIGGTLQLTISGVNGLYYKVQAASSPNPASWETVGTFVMTNNPTAIELSRPTDDPRFWRVEAGTAPFTPVP